MDLRLAATSLLLLMGQTAPGPPAKVFDLRDAIAKSLDRLDMSRKPDQRYTYLLKMRLLTLDAHGGMVGDTTRRYDVTWINNLPYMHLLEVDGEPLRGGELLRERRRYDEAIARKKALGQDSRAKTDGYLTGEPNDADLHDVLGKDYILRDAYQQQTEGRTIHVIDAHLSLDAIQKTSCPWHYTLWMPEEDPYFIRYRVDAGGDTSARCNQAAFETDFVLVDGLPKPGYASYRFNVPDKGSAFRAVQDFMRWTDYRRFQTTVTIRPPGEEPSTPSLSIPAPK